MFQNGNFDDSISKFTLKFTDPDLEAKFFQSKSRHLHWFNAGKIMIIAMVVLVTTFFLFEAFNIKQQEDSPTPTQVIITLVVLNSSWMLEFTIHCFASLHFLGGFPSIILLSWVLVYTAYLSLPTFSFVPGTLSLFLFMIFAAIFYSKNWMLATFAQTIGYLIIATLGWIYFSPKMDHQRLIVVEISMSFGLFASGFIYYYVETQQRMTIFAMWETDKVLKHKMIKFLGVTLFETAFAHNSSWHCDKYRRENNILQFIYNTFSLEEKRWRKHSARGR